MNSMDRIIKKIERLNQNISVGLESNAFYQAINDQNFIDSLDRSGLGRIHTALDRTMFISIVLAISRICDPPSDEKSSINQLIKDLSDPKLWDAIRKEHSKAPEEALKRLKQNIQNQLERGAISNTFATQIIDKHANIIKELNDLPSRIAELTAHWKEFETKYEKELKSIKNLRNDYIAHSLVLEEDPAQKYSLSRKNIEDLLCEMKNIIAMPNYIVNGSDIFYDKEACEKHCKAFISIIRTND